MQEQLFHGDGRTLSCSCLELQGSDSEVGFEIELVEQKLVGVLHFEIHRFEHCPREVLQVKGDERIGPASHCSSHNMAVIAVWKRDTVLHRLPSCDASIFKSGLHGIGTGARLTRSKFRMNRPYRVNHLV